MPSVKEKKIKSTLKAAILPSTGIGDALIFLQAADTLKKQGYDVSFFHSSIKSLSPCISSSSIYPLVPVVLDWGHSSRMGYLRDDQIFSNVSSYYWDSK